MMRLLHNTWNTKAKFSLSFGQDYGSFGEKVIAQILKRQHKTEKL